MAIRPRPPTVVLQVVAIALCLAGCSAQELWTLALWNDAGKPIVVQVSSGANRSAWLVPEDEAFTIINAPQPLTGTVELLDPRTCETLDQRDIPAVSSIISAIVDESRPSGLSLAIMLNDRLTRSDPRPPNFLGCTE
jgi:hypothetical protein